MLGLVRGHKGYRFRIYPNARQIRRMLAWEAALRYLWNLALEQRKLGLARAPRIFRTSFDQINELTELRAELPWLADVPRNVCAQALVELDKAFQRCFKKLARTPRWKRKDQPVEAGKWLFCVFHVVHHKAPPFRAGSITGRSFASAAR